MQPEPAQEEGGAAAPVAAPGTQGAGLPVPLEPGDGAVLEGPLEGIWEALGQDTHWAGAITPAGLPCLWGVPYVGPLPCSWETYAAEVRRVRSLLHDLQVDSSSDEDDAPAQAAAQADAYLSHLFDRTLALGFTQMDEEQLAEVVELSVPLSSPLDGTALDRLARPVRLAQVEISEEIAASYISRMTRLKSSKTNLLGAYDRKQLVALADDAIAELAQVCVKPKLVSSYTLGRRAQWIAEGSAGREFGTLFGPLPIPTGGQQGAGLDLVATLELLSCIGAHGLTRQLIHQFNSIAHSRKDAGFVQREWLSRIANCEAPTKTELVFVAFANCRCTMQVLYTVSTLSLCLCVSTLSACACACACACV